MIPLKDDIPTRRFPVVTVVLIAINVIVYFVFEQGVWGLGETGNERVVEYGAIPYEITNGEDVAGTRRGQAPFWLTILTSMFLHGSLLHLGGNMLFLWIFGNNIEDSMGRLDLRRLLPARRPGGARPPGGDGPGLDGPDGGRLGAIAGGARRLRAGSTRAPAWSRW